MPYCECSEGLRAPLATITSGGCDFNFGQTIRIAFQRMSDDKGVPNTFASIAEFKTRDAWTTKFTAIDDTKITLSPIFGNPVVAPGDIITFGDGNVVPKGIPIRMGKNATSFSSIFYNKLQSVIAALSQYECEDNLGCFLIDEMNVVAFDKNEDGLIIPIKAESLKLGNLKLGGKQEPNSNDFQLSLPQDWNVKVETVKMDFNLLAVI